MVKLVKITGFLALLLASSGSFAQLTTSTAQSPVQLVEDVLVGSGVAISNVSYTGHAEAIGSFNGASTNLGLNSGIILTTGTVLNSSGVLGSAQGPHGPNNESSAGVDNNQPGYGPLTNLAGADTYNAAILEFDFVPQSDTIRFKYVFGSEEYPEYVDGGFNDAFAFFISGPGFGGTYNMAAIPGGGGIVSIDNINNGPSNTGPCQNCGFYVDNGTGSSAPNDASNFYIQYDGFTVVMEAVAEVQCGETYHLVISIADAGDGAYDSGIFLEANSLASFSPIDINADLGLDAFGDNSTMAEGCETTTVTVTRQASAAQDALSIPVIIGGTATEGIDYDNIPNSINFAPGQTTISFDFNVFADGVTEGIETVIIQLDQPDPCGNSNFITLSLAIADVDNLSATVADVTVACPGEEISLKVVPTGGLPEYTFGWTAGGVTDQISVSPTTTTTYDVTVNDACLGVPITVSGTVIVPVYPPLIIVTSPDTSVLCPNTPQTLYAEATGGDGGFAFNWTANGLNLGSGTSLDVSPMVTTIYTVTVTDGCGVGIAETIIVTVEATVLELEMSPNQLICPGDSAELYVIATEGLGNYTYYWMHSAETTPDVTVSPNITTSYIVSVQDACQTYSIEGTTEVEVIRPNADFVILTNDPMENLPVSFFQTTENGVSQYWDFGNGDNSTDHSPNTTYDPWGWYEITLIAYNEIGCSDTAYKQIFIKPEFYFFAPNAFTPDGNRFNTTYGVSVIGAIEFEFQIFNRWGELIYQTTDQYFKWDGTFNNVPIQDGVLVYKAIAVDREDQLHEYTGSIVIIR